MLFQLVYCIRYMDTGSLQSLPGDYVWDCLSRDECIEEGQESNNVPLTQVLSVHRHGQKYRRGDPDYRAEVL